jgi:gliding motility-associated-like protein
MNAPGTYILLMLLLLVLSGPATLAQEPSTQGKEFYVSFFSNGGATTDPRMKFHLFITSSRATSGTIVNPRTSYSQPFNVSPNQVTIITLNKSECLTMTNEKVSNTVLKVTSADTISLFTLNEFPSSTDATVCIPTEALGTRYRVLSYGFGSMAMVMATEDSTLVEIIPKAGTLQGRIANTPFTVLLNKGQSYAMQSDSDLTGTSILSVNSCKKIAVYGGASCAEIPRGCGFCNHIYEQMLPIETWGERFIFTPTMDRIFDVVRVLANTKTNVTINGSVINLLPGEYYTQNCSTNVYLKITADRPVAVAGYTTGQVCGGGQGDPSMYWVNPVEQMLEKVVFCATPFVGIDSNYVNLIVRTQDTSLLRLNGKEVHPFVVVAADNKYAAARLVVSAGSNSIECKNGFGAYVYGYGRTNSYSYTAGSRARPTDKAIIVNGVKLMQGDSVYICNKAAADMEVDYSQGIDHIEWHFGDGNNANSIKATHNYSGTGYLHLKALVFSQTGCGAKVDTLKAVIGLPSPLNIIMPADTASCPGKYVTLTANGTGGRPSTYNFLWNGTLTGQTQSILVNSDTTIGILLSDGCSPSVSGSMKIELIKTGNVKFTADSVQCAGDAVKFTNLSQMNSNSKFHWEFGDGNSSDQKDPWHNYNGSGTFSVKLSVQSAVGCTDSHLRPDFVKILPKPVAKFSSKPPAAIIEKPLIAFNNQSNGANEYLWDFGDNGSSEEKSPTHAYTEMGLFNVKLYAKNQYGCMDSTSSNVRIYEKLTFYIPNTFTPNNDLVNDLFMPSGVGIMKYEMSIYSRWGQLLYKGENGEWDGRMETNEIAPSGNYVYMITVTDFAEKFYIHNGTVQLLE